jgi:hypothetical protein
MTSQSYDIKNGLNVLVSLPNKLNHSQLNNIMCELNILRYMNHINYLMVVNDSNDTTSLYDTVTNLNNVCNENIHDGVLDIQTIKSNKTIFSNLVVICHYNKKNDMITNLETHNLTDYLLITYKFAQNIRRSNPNVYNLLRVLVGLQTCFREPNNNYETYDLYSSGNKNILSVMLPDKNDIMQPTNNGTKDEILYLENIIDNASKTESFNSMTVGVHDDNKIIFTPTEIILTPNMEGGRIKSALTKLYNRYKKKQSKKKKPLTTSMIELHNNSRKNFDFMKQGNFARTIPTTTITRGNQKLKVYNTTHNDYKKIFATADNYKNLKRINDNNYDNIKLLIKNINIDLTKIKPEKQDKFLALEAEYDIVFNYSDLHILKLLDFVLFTDVGEPSLLNIKRYKEKHAPSEAVFSGKLNKKGKDEYKQAKSERLTKRHLKKDKTKEKLTKKRSEGRRQNKKDLIMEHIIKKDSNYKNLIKKLSNATGFKNILKRRRLQKQIDKLINATMKNYNNNLKKNNQTGTQFLYKIYQPSNKT